MIKPFLGIVFAAAIMTTQSSKVYNVFVYGTLKKGEPNHNWFNKEKDGYWKFICNAQTLVKYPLIIATKYNIPFLLYSPGAGDYVQGEVYEVDDKVLANLDILEDHPIFYVREQHEVKRLDENNTSITAWIYFIKQFQPHLLEKPMYANYSSSGEHGLNYVTSEESTLEDLN